MERDRDPWLGQTLDGRYRLTRQLGEGGMGVVYEAEHLALGEVVLGHRLAVKILRSTALSLPGALERLEREAQAASAIGDPHIIDVRDFGRLHGGQAYVVMELLEGRALWDEVREGRLPWRRAAQVARHVALGLHAAHEAGIVHRDLKPENIVLVRRGGDPDFAKILDFGIAKLHGSAAKLTRAGEVVGTPQYMAPEQCLGLSVDRRADIYALGILLYEMLTGEVPFDGDDLRAICLGHIEGAVAPPSSLGVEVPEALEAMVMGCLAKAPEARVQSMDEVADALGALLGDAPSRTPRSITPISLAPAPSSAPPPAKPRSPWLVGAAVGLGVLACAAGVATALTLARPVESASAQPSPVVAPVESSFTLPSPAPDPVRAESPPAPATSRLVAEPPAQVYDGDALLGETPLTLPRPEEGARSFTLRRPGWADREIALSPRSRDEVVVLLERERPPNPRARPTRAAPSETPASETPASETTVAAAPESSPFMNPWER
ncbi:MAG: protein kinase [Sandaracinaceae bacterium]